MTFEQLEQIAIEQDKRIFSLNCQFNYIANKDFTDYHFKEIHRNYVHNSCWEVMLKLNFPFEHIIPQIEFLHSVKDAPGKPDGYSTVKLRFSLCVLNLPGMTVSDFSYIVAKFTDSFSEFLTHFYRVPMELQSSIFSFDMNPSHSLHSAITNDKSF